MEAKYIDMLINNDNSIFPELIELTEDIRQKKLNPLWPTIINSFHKTPGIAKCTTVKERLYETFPFLKEMRIPGLCIAGGLISDFIYEKKPTKYFGKLYVRDIDIFVYGTKNIDELNDKVKQFVSKYLEIENPCNIVYNDYLVKFYSKNPIEIILRAYNNIEEILQGFDLGSSKVAFDLYSGKLYTTPIGLFSLEYKANIINLRRSSSSYARRLNKYWYKGYSIIFPDLEICSITLHNIIGGLEISNPVRIEHSIFETEYICLAHKYSKEKSYGTCIDIASSIKKNKHIYIVKDQLSQYLNIPCRLKAFVEEILDLFCQKCDNLDNIKNLNWRLENPGTQFTGFFTKPITRTDFYKGHDVVDLRNIITLPKEIVEYIFTYIPRRRLYAKILINKYFGDIANQLLNNLSIKKVENIHIIANMNIFTLFDTINVKYSSKIKLMQYLFTQNDNKLFNKLKPTYVTKLIKAGKYRILYNNHGCVIKRGNSTYYIKNNSEVLIKRVGMRLIVKNIKDKSTISDNIYDNLKLRTTSFVHMESGLTCNLICDAYKYNIDECFDSIHMFI